MAKRDGRIIALDVVSRKIIASTGVPILPDTRITSSAPCVSPDGKLWYLTARNPMSYSGGNQTILVLDVPTLSLRSVITPSRPFGALAIGLDGKRLYYSEEEPGRIYEVDALSGQEIRTLGRPSVAGTVRKSSYFLVVAR